MAVVAQVLAQVRVASRYDVRPAAQDPPAFHQVVGVTSASRFVVHKLGKRRVNDEVVALAQLQTEVDIIVRNGEELIESSDFVEGISSRHHARAGHD